MITLKKKVRLTVRKGTEDIFFTDTLRVDFDITMSMGDAINTGVFTIYNLNDKIVSLLSQKRGYIVILEVGNVTDRVLDTLFVGTLKNINHTPMFADGITTLWCWEQGYEDMLNFNPSPRTLQSTTVGGVVKEIVKSMGVFTLKVDTATRMDRPVKNFYLNSSYIKSLESIVISAGMKIAVHNRVITICDAVESSDSLDKIAKKAIKLKVNPLLMKRPIEFSMVRAKVSYVLTPSVKPLDILQIDADNPELQQTASGFNDKQLKLIAGITLIVPKQFYLITSVTHSGSLYTNEWETNVEGITHSAEGVLNG